MDFIGISYNIPLSTSDFINSHIFSSGHGDHRVLSSISLVIIGDFLIAVLDIGFFSSSSSSWNLFSAMLSSLVVFLPPLCLRFFLTSSSSGVVVMNHFRSCLYWNNLLSISILKDDFDGLVVAYFHRLKYIHYLVLISGLMLF